MAKRPGHNMANLSIIPVKNNKLVENNNPFGGNQNSAQVKMEKNEKYTDLNAGDHTGLKGPLFTLNAC